MGAPLTTVKEDRYYVKLWELGVTEDQDDQDDQNEEIADQALISAITFLATMTFHNCGLMKPDSCFLCESQALQDYYVKLSTWW